MSFQLVVIVDHGSTNLKVLGRLAQSLSEAAAVQTFADADAAVSFCAENAPDLVVAGATGEQVEAVGFVGRLRAEPGLRETPLIVIGDREDSGAIERALDAGANDYVLTPIDPGDFRLRARTLLKRRPDRRAITAPGENHWVKIHRAKGSGPMRRGCGGRMRRCCESSRSSLA